jgi:hypothetical protein
MHEKNVLKTGVAVSDGELYAVSAAEFFISVGIGGSSSLFARQQREEGLDIDSLTNGILIASGAIKKNIMPCVAENTHLLRNNSGRSVSAENLPLRKRYFHISLRLT